MAISEFLHTSSITNTLFLPRSRGSWPASVSVRQPLPYPITRLPYRLIAPLAQTALERAFLKTLRELGPERSVAYFWPAPSLGLLDAARGTGAVMVREMINSCVGTAKRILDHAFAEAGLPPSHTITPASVAEEKHELGRYDYVFSSNAMVDASLVEAGVEPGRIIRTSFGWSPARFGPYQEPTPPATFTALFAGTIGVRKGVLPLLAAWRKLGLKGQLVFAGGMDPDIVPLLAPYRDDPTISFLPYVEDLGKLYRSASVFVFPSLEEGGPQVVYEAAGCGLPVIATPMGAGRLVRDGRNGLIVQSLDVDTLAAALLRLYEDADLRATLAAQARIDSLDYTYEQVGLQRAEALSRIGPAR